MKRKDYRKPTMKVVQLHHQCQILAGSEHSSATLNSTYSEEDWDNE